MLLCERIRQARIAAGLSQLRAAEMAGVSNTQWCRYETGAQKPPLGRHDLIYGVVLGLDVDELESEFGL